MHTFTRLAVAAAWVLIGTGCVMNAGTTEQAAPTAVETTTAAVEMTSQPPVEVPTETTQPTPEQVSGRVQAVVVAQGVNLRQGPGTLFQPRKLLDVNTRLTVLGRARGDDWLLVETEGIEGWISVSYVEIENDAGVAVLPVQNPGDAIILRGQVSDSFGGPVEGVIFAIMQGGGENTLRVDATTRKDGFFYAYLPPDATGTWRVALTGVDCHSPIVDEDCALYGRFAPTWKDITLPITELVTFQYLAQ
jgi:hypothetical protein